MRDLMRQLVESAGMRGHHAELRWVDERRETVRMRNGEPAPVVSGSRSGFGVRVKAGGGWAFAAARGDGRAQAEAALAKAIAIAQAAPTWRARQLTPPEPVTASHAAPCAIDPFAVATEDKLALLAEADAATRAVTGVAVATGTLQSRREHVVLATSDGTLVEQERTECGGGIAALAVGDAGAQIRSYPGSHSGSVAQAGWEHVERLALAAAAPRVAEEAVALLRAPACPAGPSTLVLAGEQLAIQIHESVGHAVELDRILGEEASYAGTSFVAPGDVGSLRYGSELMSVTADATLPGGLGSFAWDDEGTPARTLGIVRGGVLRDALSSRASAAAAALPRSGGCMRAEGFDRQPIVRMTNVSLDPGCAGTLEDLIAATDHGLLIDTNRSWSIDSRRLHFQFAGEAAWEIGGGRLGRLLRDPVYSGITPAFWSRLDAVCSQEAWHAWSVTDCGKGEPGQFIGVTHGCAPARFREVEVGAR